MRMLLSIIASAAMLMPDVLAHAVEPSRPIVIAHRGGALLMPENTLPAFDHAIALGAECLGARHGGDRRRPARCAA